MLPDRGQIRCSQRWNISTIEVIIYTFSSYVFTSAQNVCHNNWDRCVWSVVIKRDYGIDCASFDTTTAGGASLFAIHETGIMKGMWFNYGLWSSAAVLGLIQRDYFLSRTSLHMSGCDYARLVSACLFMWRQMCVISLYTLMVES